MNNFMQSKMSSFGYGYKANVLSHLSWISWIIIPSSFSGLIFGKDWYVKLFCILVIAFLLVYNVIKYEYWSKKDPDRLQTERYNLEKRRIDIYASKGGLPHEIDPSETMTPMLLNHKENGGD